MSFKPNITCKIIYHIATKSSGCASWMRHGKFDFEFGMLRFKYCHPSTGLI